MTMDKEYLKEAAPTPQVHVRGWKNMPRSTKNALSAMIVLAVAAIERGDFDSPESAFHQRPIKPVKKKNPTPETRHNGKPR